ncbi:Orn/Lys/Arg decarboxylase, major region [Alkaliphilus metalliredigens QYMF]|uniref:Orn/Lys/Arg decarboxylase, major region n=1 Tax=Alkaliphilus metalliredigens (strain QYMF) TaxID=293826 RepID=A6TJF6_ALKMQ|nr:aminotransferase class I/II-fold pyridoxal phosphate-dependent enzyme [Alkaliphilus metalliredigens]ABR46324.1 Orn/Lys/Arg decarboxylase, major region [Alkaliphilus metalliredigens QYMF]
MSEVPILDRLLQLQKQDIVSFHVPGHKNGKIYHQFPYKNFTDFLMHIDTTEIPGTDNLHNPKEIIKEAQERASRAFHSKETFFLVNGSTSGIYSMVMACTEPGDKIIVDRNCHQSVINSTILGDLNPVYLYPEIEIEQGISLGVSPQAVEQMIQEHLDAKAMIITYPTYHGITSDLKKIAEIVHKYDKILLIDEAHGAHFGLSQQLPATALACGADAVVQSTHKTLPSFTQSSMLHIQGDRIDRNKLKTMLRIHQSSSPSYLLLASLDLATMIYDTQGKYLMEQLLQHITYFKAELADIEGIEILGGENHDATRLWISLKHLGVTGYQLEKRLRDQYQIQMELANIYGVLGVATIGNQRRDFDRLIKALKNIAQEKGNQRIKEMPPFTYRIPKQVLRPGEALHKRKETIPLLEARGQISGEYVIPYPPGIPIVIPGEVIDKEMIQYIDLMVQEGMEIVGMKDASYKTIQIIKADEI